MFEFLILLIWFLILSFLDCLWLLPFEILFYKESASVTGKMFRYGLAFILGLVIGYVVLLFMHPATVASSVLRIAALIAVPIMFGLLSFLISYMAKRLRPGILPKDHFWYGFCLCLGYLIVCLVAAIP